MQLPNTFAVRCFTQGTALRRQARLFSSLEIQKFFQTLRKISILKTYLLRRVRGVMPASNIRRSAIPPGRHCGDGRRQARLFSSLEIQKFFQTLRQKSSLRVYLMRRPRGVIPASNIRMSAIPPGRHCGDGRRQARLFSSLETQKFFQTLRKKSILKTYLLRRVRGATDAFNIRCSAIPPGRHCGDGRRHAFCRRAGSAGIARWRSSGSVNSESRSVS